jgi:hypothetical protein
MKARESEWAAERLIFEEKEQVSKQMILTLQEENYKLRKSRSVSFLLINIKVSCFLISCFSFAVCFLTSQTVELMEYQVIVEFSPVICLITVKPHRES